MCLGNPLPWAVCIQGMVTAHPRAGPGPVPQALQSQPCLGHEPGPRALLSPPPGLCQASSLSGTVGAAGARAGSPGTRLCPLLPGPSRGGAGASSACRQRPHRPRPAPAATCVLHATHCCLLEPMWPLVPHSFQHWSRLPASCHVSRGTVSWGGLRVPLPPPLTSCRRSRSCGEGPAGGPAGSRAHSAASRTPESRPRDRCQGGTAGWAQPGASLASSGSVSPAGKTNDQSRAAAQPPTPRRLLQAPAGPA